MDNAAAAPVSLSMEDLALRRGSWRMLALSVAGILCCSTSVLLMNVGIFMEPMANSLGWGRAAVSAALSVAAVSMALANPLVGRLIDRYGVRAVLIGSLAGYGAATASIPTLIGLFGIWGLYLGFILVAGLGAGSNMIAYTRILSGWFSGPMNHHRGIALGIASAGLMLGGAVTSPLAVELIAGIGWQGAFVGLGLLPLVIGLPVAIFGIRMAPGDLGSGTRGEGADLPGLDMAEVVRSKPFWLMIGIVLLTSSCLQGIGIHLTPLLTDLGIQTNDMALLLALTSILGLVGRVVSGFLFDRFFAPRVSVWIFAIGVVTTLPMAFSHNLKVVIIASIINVISNGAESDLVGYMVGRYFGLKSYGQIFGWIYGMFMVGIATGPFLFGLAFDNWHNYQVPFLAAAAGLAIICALLLALPRFPAAYSE